MKKKQCPGKEQKKKFPVFVYESVIPKQLNMFIIYITGKLFLNLLIWFVLT